MLVWEDRVVKTADTQLRWWVRGDLDGFFGLFSNSMANTLTAIFLLSVVAKLPGEIVFSSIVPAIVLSLAFGNIYFAFQAYRLAKLEGRSDVTALPYGISVPHYFIVTFAILIPVITTTNDPMRAWSIGVAWCFVHAVVVAICAFIGPWLRKVTPRAAMLGTLAGVAITYIAANAAFQAFDVAWLALVCFGILLFGWFAQVRFPFNLPAGLVAILVGTLLGWVTGYMQPGPLARGGLSDELQCPNSSSPSAVSGSSACDAVSRDGYSTGNLPVHGNVAEC
jgi:AGZA family xanthine/uracil permease-like MFS transporter